MSVPDKGGNEAGWEYQSLIDWINRRVIDAPGQVVLAFLLLTGIFVLGLSNVSTEAGTQQFTTGLESEQALEKVNEEFSPSFQPDSGGTSLIQRDSNVLGKPALVRMLQLQHRINERPGLRVSGTTSAAQIVATQVDRDAQTLAEKIRTIRNATPSEIDRAVNELADRERFTSVLSRDFNARAASASATIGTVSHSLPSGLSGGAGQGGSSPLTSLQQRIVSISQSVTGDFTVFGTGIIAQENSSVIGDSLIIVVPGAAILIFVFLIVAYRDPLDLLLGLVSLIITIIWTFGFLGLANIPFSPLLITIPPLLLAVGVDFGIHAINRYREERTEGVSVETAMRTTTDQLIVAFFIVTGTTVVGFLSNLSSALPPIRDFGLIAAVGIVFTFLIFGIFLPAAKIGLDRLRERSIIPTLSDTPLASEGSIVSSLLQIGVVLGKRAPALFLVVVLIMSAGAGAYASGIDTSFSQEQFLPPENIPDELNELPEPFRPGQYTATGTLNFLEEQFEASQQSSVIVLLETSMTKESVLEEIQRTAENPPDSFVRTDGSAEYESIVGVIRAHASENPEFERLIKRNDPDNDGIPEDNLRSVYDALLESSARSDALRFLAEDYGSAQLIYSIEADASDSEVTTDAREFTAKFRGEATPTGVTIVFQAVSDLILESALVSLILALSATGVFLMIIYRVLEGQATLGIANLVPIVTSVAFIAAAMRFLNVGFNPITATIFSITIGLGIDYSVHVVHRFADERKRRALLPALERTIRGTGGALLGSMLTTSFGIGTLVLALFPIIQAFGIVTALSISFSFLSSVVILPPTLIIWDYFINGNRALAPLFGIGTQPWQGAVAADDSVLPTADVVTDQAPDQQSDEKEESDD